MCVYGQSAVKRSSHFDLILVVASPDDQVRFKPGITLPASPRCSAVAIHPAAAPSRYWPLSVGKGPKKDE